MLHIPISIPISTKTSIFKLKNSPKNVHFLDWFEMCFSFFASISISSHFHILHTSLRGIASYVIRNSLETWRLNCCSSAAVALIFTISLEKSCTDRKTLPINKKNRPFEWNAWRKINIVEFELVSVNFLVWFMNIDWYENLISTDFHSETHILYKHFSQKYWKNVHLPL